MFKSLAGYYKVGKDTSFAFGGRLTFFYPTRKKGCCFSLSLELRLLVKYSRKRKRTTGTVRKDDARTVSSTAKQAHGGGAHRAERFGAPEKLRVESGAFLWVFLVFVFLVVLTSFLCREKCLFVFFKVTLRLPFFSLFFPFNKQTTTLLTPKTFFTPYIGRQLTLAEPVPQRVETVAGRYTEDSSEDL